MVKLAKLLALSTFAIMGASACSASNSPATDAVADLSFDATLTGDRFPAETGSSATGAATLTIHPDETVDLALSVKGVTIDDLSDPLVASAFGPAHLHLYKPDGEIEFLMVFPFGGAFSKTAAGFDVIYKRLSFSQSAEKFNPDMTIEDLIAGLRTGYAYLNVHTDKHPDVEISGVMEEQVAPKN